LPLPVVREATHQDRSRLGQMGERFALEYRYRQLFPAITPRSIDDLVVACLDEGIVFVGELGGQVVGMIAGVPSTLPITGEIVLNGQVWWVEPEARATRCGPLLLHTLESWSYKNGIFMVKMASPWGSNIAGYLGKHGYSNVEVELMKRLE
jgi:hypothetical protein